MAKKTHSFIRLYPGFAVVFFSCTASPQVKETPPNPPAIETVIETTIKENLFIESESKTEIQSVEARVPVLDIPAVLAVEPEIIEPNVCSSPPIQEAPIQEETPQAVLISTVSEIPASQYPIWSKQLSPAQAPERSVKPEVPEFIMGNGVISPETMSAFLLAANPEAEKEFAENLASIYIEESAIEGINHDTAFAQMCLETGFLSFTGLVSPEQNNFCGLGSIGPGQPGEIFPDPRTGVRAHIQHLKAYATDTPLKQELVDPRYFFVRFGSSPEIRGLSGTWAADLLYADKISNILERLYNFAYGI